MSDSFADMKPMRILLVEDSEDNVLVVQLYLKNYPFELDVAKNGEVGVEKYQSGEYDLILLDIQMPIMDGYAAARAIRDIETDRDARRVPIIAVTAHASAENKRMVLEAGCDDFITKPVPKVKLLEAIQRFAS